MRSGRRRGDARVRACLGAADELGARSVAFPAIATGRYGYPVAEAARIAVETIRATPTEVERVLLVAFDEQHHHELVRQAGP